MSSLLLTRRGTRRQPEASRGAILQAALVEFAQEGLAGARMDAIAAAAGVNKALLYYYFRDKEALYGAVLDEFFIRLLRRVTQALAGAGPAGERLLTYARAHFDCIAESPHYARLFQGELMSAGSGRASHLERVVEQYIRPISIRVVAVLQEGIASGEFRRVDAMQFAPSMVGMIVHYFVVAPVARKLLSRDPFSPGALRQRRAAVLDFIAAALFADQFAGVKLAARVATLAEAGPGVGSNVAKAPKRPFRVQGKRR
ncbi:MAG: TetR/AcrR family transcriptional regulator [Candidatus Korobacteraceae bacterium]